MSLFSVLAVALSLSMDNLAASLAAGCSSHRRVSHAEAAAVSGIFALAHVVMFSLGWFGGQQLGKVIHAFDHWLAFGMLGWVGGKMLVETYKNTHPQAAVALTYKRISWLAIATSLDALGVGIALFFASAPFVFTVGTLAGCVFATSLVGFWAGGILGRRMGRWMEAFGGIVLIGLGVKILLSGLGIW